jgi:hypothetical protein
MGCANLPEFGNTARTFARNAKPGCAIMLRKEHSDA